MGMITTNKIKSVLRKGRDAGLEIQPRDIACVLLKTLIKEEDFVYGLVFGFNHAPETPQQYFASNTVTFIREQLKGNIAKTSTTSMLRDISFEENKDALIGMLAKIRELAKTGELAPKDALQLEKDVRVKLIDKFGVSTDKNEKRVVVNAKYNHICEWTRRECFLQTKEYAMEHWGLVEKGR